MHLPSCVFILLVINLSITIALPRDNVRDKRQLADDDALQPLEDIDSGAEQNREKRKLEGVTQAKFGIKNALLGFVFGPGTLSQLQSRTVTTTPSRRSTPMSPKVSSLMSPRVTSPTLPIGGPGPNIGGTQYQVPRVTGSHNNGLRLPRQTPTTKDGIPIFDRNKVSLDFPGSLFGPSVSLLIKTTKIAGEVIQNSAVRYQSFLRLFRPLFRGPFEIKGLDPPTTTTTTTEPPAAANEVRR